MSEKAARKLTVSTSASGDATVIEMTVPPGTPAREQGSLSRYGTGGNPSTTTTTFPPLSLDEVKNLRAELDQVIEHAERKPEPWKK